MQCVTCVAVSCVLCALGGSLCVVYLFIFDALSIGVCICCVFGLPCPVLCVMCLVFLLCVVLRTVFWIV